MPKDKKHGVLRNCVGKKLLSVKMLGVNAFILNFEGMSPLMFETECVDGSLGLYGISITECDKDS